MFEPDSPSNHAPSTTHKPHSRKPRQKSLKASLHEIDLRVYQTVRSTVGWVKRETKTKTRLPLTRKLAMWRQGFFAESGSIYNLAHNSRRDYLTDFQHFVGCSRINAWAGFYAHKLILRSYLLAMGFRQAATVALILDHRIRLNPYAESARSASPDELLDVLRTGGRDRQFIVKPEDGWCGEDIFLLLAHEGALFRRRGGVVEPFDLDTFLTEREQPKKGSAPSATLIEERIEQGEFWERLFPDSANTIRILTLWPPDEPRPFLARAVQRIGTVDTVPTDNWSGGGISAPIDPVTGRLGTGRMHPLKGHRGDQAFARHPDSGTQIAGSIIPNWSHIADTVLRAAGSLPFNRMGGWDVLVDRGNTPIILEANGNSDVNLLQVHRGLLAEPRIRDFYQAYGVL